MGDQAPANTAYMGMGRPLFDRATLEADGVPQSLIEALMAVAALAAAMGYATAHEGDGPTYQNAVLRYEDPNWILYAGRPDTPLDPDVVSLTSGGSAIIVERDNTVINAAATVLNFSTAFTVVDAGSGQVDVDVSGGGGSTNAFGTITVDGQDDVAADAAPDTVEFEALAGILISTSAGGTKVSWAIDTSAVAQLAFTSVVVSGQTTVTASGPATALTLVAGSNVTITTNNTSKTVTIASSYVNTTYTAGAGINLSGTKFIADPNTASHVGLVDPATGDDSSADDAQIGILWHAIANYDVDENMLIGHAASDSSKPVIEYKTVEDWLKTLPGYATRRVLVSNEDGDVEWYTINEMLDLLTGRNDANNQSIGADAAGSPEWQDDTDECP